VDIEERLNRIQVAEIKYVRTVEVRSRRDELRNELGIFPLCEKIAEYCKEWNRIEFRSKPINIFRLLGKT
jgi:hypothetical protein